MDALQLTKNDGLGGSMLLWSFYPNLARGAFSVKHDAFFVENVSGLFSFSKF